MRAFLHNKPPLGTGLALGHPLTQGLFARFAFNEGNGTRLNNLAMPGGRGDAVLTGMDPATAWTRSSRGPCLSFDGVNDVATTTVSTGPTSTMSLSVWFRTTTGQTGVVLMEVPGGGLFDDVALKLYTAANVGCEVGTVSVSVAATYSDGLWHHLAMTYNSDRTGAEVNQRLYFDGQLIGTATSPETVLADPGPLTIGDGTLGGAVLADIADARAYRRELSAAEIAYLYRDPYADTHRPIYWFPERAHATREVEFYINGDWRDVTSDVRLWDQATIDYGMGTGPLDLVASSGTFTFALANGESNSAGLVGYYSPDHANCRSGFVLGIPVRYTERVSGVVYRKHVGWLEAVQPIAGQERERKTLCTSLDWMNQAAKRYPITIPTAIDKRMDELLAIMAGAVPRSPTAIDFDEADTTAPFAFDSSQSDKQPVLSEAQRIAQNEYASGIYVEGDGTLCFRRRRHRITPEIVATFSDDMLTLEIMQDLSRLVNRAKVTNHPKRADADATSVLFELPSEDDPLEVLSDKSITVDVTYNDPDNRDVRIGGINMQPVTQTTDYTMNRQRNGTGANLTASFTVDATLGANGGKMVITNGSAFRGFITKLQARGQGLKDFDAVDVVQSDEDSITAYGESELTIDRPYASEVSEAQSIAQYILLQFANPATTEAACGFLATTDAMRATVLSLEPRHAISITETVTGIAHVFWVQHITLRFPSTDTIAADFLLQRAPDDSYFTLDTSLLDGADTLAPL